MSESEAPKADAPVSAALAPSEADDVLISSDSGEAVNIAPAISVSDIIAAEKARQSAVVDPASTSAAPASGQSSVEASNNDSSTNATSAPLIANASNSPITPSNDVNNRPPAAKSNEDPSVNITNSINMNEEEKDQLGTLPSPMSVIVLHPAPAASSDNLTIAPSSTANTIAGSDSSSGLLAAKSDVQMIKRCPSGIVRMTGKKKAEDHHYPPQLLMHSSPTNRASNTAPNSSPVALKSSSSYALYSRPHESPIHAGSQRHKSNQSQERTSALNVFTLSETENHHQHHTPHGRRNSFSRKTTVKFTHEISEVCVFDMVSYNTHGQTMGLRKGTLVECDDPKLTDEVLQEEQYFCFCLPMPNYKQAELIKVHVWTSHGYDGYVPASALRPLPADQQKEVPIPEEYLQPGREPSSESLAS